LSIRASPSLLTLRAMNITLRRRRLASIALIASLPLLLPAGVLAHSELKTVVPADGATVTGTPPEIVLTFTAALNPAKSSITLNAPDGTEIAKAGVDTANNTVMRMTPPQLPAGAYQIRWTSTSTDGDILRGVVHFTVVAATPSPSASPTATASASPSPTPSAVSSSSSSPSSSPTGSGTTTSSSSDVLLPILAAIVVLAVLGGWLLRARSRTGRGT
jgi:methionine-rich copper-binding protein CopC